MCQKDKIDFISLLKSLDIKTEDIKTECLTLLYLLEESIDAIHELIYLLSVFYFSYRRYCLKSSRYYIGKEFIANQKFIAVVNKELIFDCSYEFDCADYVGLDLVRIVDAKNNVLMILSELTEAFDKVKIHLNLHLRDFMKEIRIYNMARSFLVRYYLNIENLNLESLEEFVTKKRKVLGDLEEQLNTYRKILRDNITFKESMGMSENQSNYTIYGHVQAGAFGNEAQAGDVNFKNSGIGEGNDLATLFADLSKLRAELKHLSKEVEGDEVEEAKYDKAIGLVTFAQEALKNNDQSKALEYLKQTGRWVLDIAEKIGVGVAVGVIKRAIGM